MLTSPYKVATVYGACNTFDFYFALHNCIDSEIPLYIQNENVLCFTILIAMNYKCFYIEILMNRKLT